MRVIRAKGLKLPTRQHFATGIMSYLASPFWLFQLIVGIALVLQTTYIRPEYFSRDFAPVPGLAAVRSRARLGALRRHDGDPARPKLFGLILMLFRSEGRQEPAAARSGSPSRP